MEIMDDDKLRRDEHASVIRSRNLFLGVTLIVVGVLWMMNNLELLSAKKSELIERTKIAESVYDLFRQGGIDDVREKLIDVM